MQVNEGNGDSNGTPLAARVVLVGRTGLDAALRLDPGIELLRARTAIDAVGELASPIDDTQPLDSTVIIHTDSDPTNGSGGSAAAAAFVEALRLIDPEVRVLLSGTGKRGVYDGVILSALIPQESLRAMVRRSMPKPEPRPEAARPAPPIPPSAFLRPPAPPTPPLPPPPPATSPPTPAPTAAAPAATVPVATPRAPREYPEQAGGPTNGSGAAYGEERPAALPAREAPTIGPDGSSVPTTVERVARPVVVRPGPTLAPPPVSPDLSNLEVSAALPAGVEPDVVEAPATPISPPEAPRASAAGADDSKLIEAMLTGRDPILPAMEVLRARTGLSDLAFVEADGPPTPPVTPTSPNSPAAAPTERASVGVTHKSRVFGTLHSAMTDPNGLAPHAKWLAGWLALREQHDQLREAAFTDDLTGAYNRRYFDKFLGAAIERARGERLTVTVLYFDIDEFKTYNDRYGHMAGDQILKETVRLLKSVIRPSDRVARVGGDEFAVVFFEPAGPRDPASKPPGSIMAIAERFQRQICEHRFPKLAEEAPGTLTVSGGLATFPWDGNTPQELVEVADSLAIQSKRKGKNVITLGPGAERVCRV